MVFLKEQGFDVYWQETLRPRLGSRISVAHTFGGQSNINVVPEVETVVGFGLPSAEVTSSIWFTLNGLTGTTSSGPTFQPSQNTMG